MNISKETCKQIIESNWFKQLYKDGGCPIRIPELDDVINKETLEQIKHNCLHFLTLQKEHHASSFEIDQCISWVESEIDQRISLVETQEITNPQDIVHCKDCAHRPQRSDDADDDNDTGFVWDFPDEICPCQCEDGYYSWCPKDDFFCGHGERK